MVDTKNIWCAEYSVEQDAFHVETLERCIEHSKNIILSGQVVDYNIIGAFNSKFEANAYIDKLIKNQVKAKKKNGNKMPPIKTSC